MRGIVCRVIKNNTQSGTGFLLNEKKVITANHVVKKLEENENEEIKLFFNNISDTPIETTAHVIDRDEINDVALLEIEHSINEINNLKFLNISTEKIRENSNWWTFGYPKKRATTGLDLNGIVKRFGINEPGINFDLDLTHDVTLENYTGFSGSPLIINDKLYGVILKRINGTIGAVSFLKLANFLIKNKIISNANKSKIINYIENTIINSIVKRINSTNGGYFLIKGSPGTGKSTFIKMFPRLDGIDNIGKYLFKDNEDSTPIMYKASFEILVQWLEDVLFKAMNIQQYRTVDSKKHILIEKILNLFYELEGYYEKIGRKGIIFIDGIDELSKQQREDLFSLLPLKKLNNIYIILSCQNEIKIPQEHKNLIGIKDIFSLIPLEKDKVRAFTYQNIKGHIDSIKIADEIAEKSEGHPLYLKYLIDEATSKSDEQELQIWLEGTPKIDGNIGKYYESIWGNFQSRVDELYILATISRLREPISINDFRTLLSQKNRIVLVNFIEEIIHLIYSKDFIFIYHSSFNEFIKERTSFIEYDIQEDIAKFCKENTNGIYSVRNILHHLLLQKQEQKNEVIEYCSQEWTDHCVINHVAPDRVLQDLLNVIDFSIKSKVKITETIRLLLLSQRIKYRYNKIFTTCIYSFSELLFEEEQYANVLKYLIRNENLLVDEESFIQFLIKFYEHGANKEAKALFELFESEIFKKIEKNELLTFDLYIYLKSLVVLSIYESGEYRDKFIKILMNLDRDNDEDNGIYTSIVSFNVALLIIKKKQYIDIETIRNRFEELQENATYYLIQILNNINENIDLFINTDLASIQMLVNDLVSEINGYDFTDINENQTIYPLIDFEVNSETISDILNRVDKNINLDIRKSNGVDFNKESYENFYVSHIYKGFLKGEYTIKNLHPQNNWESYIEDVISYLGYLRGKYWRYKSEGNLQAISDSFEVDIRNKLFDLINFNLNQRHKWERSYFLVEDAFVHIYYEIAQLFKNYFINQIDVLLDCIYERMDCQLGLYTEGYRESIFGIISVLDFKNTSRIKLFNIIKKLEDHVVIGVHNRIERVEALLQIAILYQKNNNNKSSTESFRKMLKSSMGPSWYKEDQFSLIGTALTCLINSKDTRSHLPMVANILDYASGEITFKRYVRYEQEDFIGYLCNIGLLREGINYFKNSFLPLPRTLFENVEYNQIDYVQEGNGYNFGANTLDIQNCIMKIINSIDGIDHSIKWAYSELYFLGDLRHFNSFIGIFIDILEKNINNIDSYIERLKKIYISDLDERRRKDFIIEVKRIASSDLYTIIVSEFAKANIEFQYNENSKKMTNLEQKEENSNSQSNLYFPGTFGTSNSLNDADVEFEKGFEELQMQNVDEGIEYLIHGLNIIQDGGWNIWSQSTGVSLDNVLMVLLENTTHEELIYYLKDAILEEKYVEDWFIVNKILNLIGNNVDTKTADSLLNITLNHLKMIVDLPDENIDKYNWLDSDNKTNVSVELVNFLIWSINLPINIIKYRVLDILIFCSKLNPNLFIPILIESSLKEERDYTNEVCASILYKLNDLMPGLVEPYLEHDYIIRKVNEIKHFGIRYIYHNLLKVPLLGSSKTLPMTNEDIDPEMQMFWRKSIPILGELEALGVWSPADFITLEQKTLNRYDLADRQQLIKYKKYLARAYNKENDMSFFINIYLSNVNIILGKYIGTSYENDIFRILNNINLHYPSLNFRNYLEKSLKISLEDLKDDIGKFVNSLLEGDHFVAYYNEVTTNEKVTNIEDFEVICYLKKKGYHYDKDFELGNIYREFDNSEIYIDELGSEKEDYLNIRPLIAKCKFNKEYLGGVYTPARVFKSIIDLDKKAIINETWVDERSMNPYSLGCPLKEGTRTLINKSYISELNIKGWVVNWLIQYNGNETLVIIDPEFGFYTVL